MRLHQAGETTNIHDGLLTIDGLVMESAETQSFQTCCPIY